MKLKFVERLTKFCKKKIKKNKPNNSLILKIRHRLCFFVFHFYQILQFLRFIYEKENTIIIQEYI
jgi:hypothetical protein